MEIRDSALVPSPDQLWTFQYRCPAYAYPCAGLNTTLGDLLKWDAALSSGAVQLALAARPPPAREIAGILTAYFGARGITSGHESSWYSSVQS